jgi:3-oxoisoapionate kinase
VDRIIAVSGSCSPATESQIRWAVQHGFRSISLDIRNMQPSACEEALRHLEAGSSVTLHTALGAADPKLVNAPDEFHERAGSMLGQMLRELLRRSGVRRAVICGGDTSARAGQQLGIYALTMRQPLAPGVPLCSAHSDDPAFAGLEIAFKGGQVGGEDFLGLVRDGGRKGTSQT